MKSNPQAIQSVERAFALLEAMAEAGGEAGITELAATTDLPLPTIHRSIQTLVSLGYLRQAPNRRYALGARLLYLGDAAGRGVSSWVRPRLIELAEMCGESVNLAVLDGDQVAYISQAPSKHSMRMFTEVGRRVLPHASAVGKAMLANLSDADAQNIIVRTGLPRFTQNTFTTWDSLRNSLSITRARGYAIDDGEQEVGVRCVAVALPTSLRRMAVSISGPESRVTNSFIAEYVNELKRLAQDLSKEIAATT